MTQMGLVQIAIYLVILLILAKPLGWYIAQVYEMKPCGLDRVCKPVESFIYKMAGINASLEMNWKCYLSSMLAFNLLGLVFVYFLQRIQFYLPLNPQHFSAPSAFLAFNTAVSFVTNTNWQAYGGETTMSYLTQMVALTSLNFISAATGTALLFAFIRGLTRHEASSLGNFWVDVVRGILYIYLPLSLIFSVVLVSQGVIQNFKPYQPIARIQFLHEQSSLDDKKLIANQQEIHSLPLLPMGPVASQVAIKQLGTNGGGFFNTNSAHPFENPTPVTNFLEMLAILLIPAALCYSLGILVGDKRQGRSILTAMFIVFIPLIFLAVMAEQSGNPALVKMGVDPIPQSLNYSAGNMEGKETRFGIVSSALWATATTATSNGSVNSMHDSFTPIGGMVTVWMMHIGEVIFGGVGSGLYSMLMLVIITVFVAGLMVGRTPEYLGKKIEPYEMKMATIAILIMPITVLIFTSLGLVTQAGVSAVGNPGAHGFTEILYAFSSMGNNNGSAFSGLHADTPFYNLLGGMAMLIGRYWIAMPMLAIAGSLVTKKIIPYSAGTLTTHAPIFIILLVSIVVIIGALSFLPALALGPVVEQLLL